MFHLFCIAPQHWLEENAIFVCIMNSLEADDDGPGQTNPRKRKHFRRRVSTPDHTLAQNFKNEFIKKKAKVARVSLKKEIDAFCDVSIMPSSAVMTLPIVDTIKVGSDCTGIGTELLALRLIKIDHVSVFGSEIHEATRRVYYGLHGPKAKLHFDIFKRPKTHGCDIYIAGPPCQTWSTMGTRTGLEDLAGRGLVFYSCLEYIRDQRPRAVVLENVVGLRNLHPAEFCDILTILKAIGYAVTWKILDSRGSGLPQRRPRVYIVGIRADSISSKFSFPQDMEVKPKIEKFLNASPATRWVSQTQTQRRNLEAARKTILAKGLQGTILIDLAASAGFENQGVGIAPCITANRAKTGGFFIFNQKRMTTTDELGRLQGFPTWAVDKMMSSADPRDVRFAIGNAMSVNVLVRLLPRVIQSAGLLKTKPRDIWKHLSSKNAQACKVLPDDMYN